MIFKRKHKDDRCIEGLVDMHTKLLEILTFNTKEYIEILKERGCCQAEIDTFVKLKNDYERNLRRFIRATRINGIDEAERK